MDEYWATWRTTSEDQLHKLGMFCVVDSPDLPSKAENRAARSLPLNLSLQLTKSKWADDDGVLGVWANVLIPRGTRFGPYVGKIVTFADTEANPGMDKKYFWRIFNSITGQLAFIKDGKDIRYANWMRHVQPAFDYQEQNLVAYQEGQDIYFLAIRQINPHEELFVWYAHDLCKRMNYPSEGRLLLENKRYHPEQFYTVAEVRVVLLKAIRF